MLGLRVLLGAVGPDLLEDLHGTGRQLPGPAVDELQLPLHAEAGALRGLEGDLHAGSLGSITRGHRLDHPTRRRSVASNRRRRRPPVRRGGGALPQRPSARKPALSRRGASPRCGVHDQLHAPEPTSSNAHPQAVAAPRRCTRGRAARRRSSSRRCRRRPAAGTASWRRPDGRRPPARRRRAPPPAQVRAASSSTKPSACSRSTGRAPLSSAGSPVRHAANTASTSSGRHGRSRTRRPVSVGCVFPVVTGRSSPVGRPTHASAGDPWDGCATAAWWGSALASRP